jgi:hypothetical protein
VEDFCLFVLVHACFSVTIHWGFFAEGVWVGDMGGFTYGQSLLAFVVSFSVWFDFSKFHMTTYIIWLTVWILDCYVCAFVGFMYLICDIRVGSLSLGKTWE